MAASTPNWKIWREIMDGLTYQDKSWDVDGRAREQDAHNSAMSLVMAHLDKIDEFAKQVFRTVAERGRCSQKQARVLALAVAKVA